VGARGGLRAEECPPGEVVLAWNLNGQKALTNKTKQGDRVFLLEEAGGQPFLCSDKRKIRSRITKSEAAIVDQENLGSPKTKKKTCNTIQTSLLG